MYSKLAVAAMSVSMPIAVWCWVGPLDEAVRLPPTVDPNYDYLIRPTTLGPSAERAVGLTSTLILVASAVVVLSALRRRSLDRHWVPVAVWAGISGAALGGAARVVTAGTQGANIGGALLLVVLPPVVLIGWAIVAIRRYWLHRRRATAPREWPQWRVPGTEQ
jgi:uncharacterized membrane protein YfcA